MILGLGEVRRCWIQWNHSADHALSNATPPFAIAQTRLSLPEPVPTIRLVSTRLHRTDLLT